jgi:hypothetical protein
VHDTYGLIYSYYNIIMADSFRPLYDPRQLSGTSGAEVSDLRPEQAYDTDMRRVAPEDRRSVESVNDNQGRVEKYFKAAKTAGKFRQKASIDEPQIRGKTPRSESSIDGVELPSLGDTYGTVGSTGYARKPLPSFGKGF